MAKPRATGADARLIGITEVTYGTAPTDGYFGLPFKSTDLDKETPIGDDPLLGQGRAAQGAYYDRPSVSGGFEIPLDIQSAGFWLHGLLGAPTTTGTNPYTHVFTAGGATPSKTLEVGHAQLATPSYRRYLGVNLNDFSFTLSPRGVASARINVVAQSRVIAATSIDASPATTYVVTRFSQGMGSIKVGGTQVAYVTAGEFNFTNSPDVVETIRADGLIDGVDMGQAKPSGSMTVRLSDHATQTTLQTAFDNQAPVVLQYGFTHSGGWSLMFDMPRVLLAAPKAPITGPGGVEQQIAWQAENDSTAGYGLRATLVNNIASYA